MPSTVPKVIFGICQTHYNDLQGTRISKIDIDSLVFLNRI